VRKIGAVILQGQYRPLAAEVVLRRSLLETMKGVIEMEVSCMHDPEINEEKQDCVSSHFIALKLLNLYYVLIPATIM